MEHDRNHLIKSPFLRTPSRLSTERMSGSLEPLS